jgi:outer membrane protein insertion porin family
VLAQNAKAQQRLRELVRCLSREIFRVLTSSRLAAIPHSRSRSTGSCSLAAVTPDIPFSTVSSIPFSARIETSLTHLGKLYAILGLWLPSLSDLVGVLHFAYKRGAKYLVGIFKEPISTFIDRPSPTDPNTAVTDMDVFIRAEERGRFSAKTGTDVGNTEGSAYAEVQLRNIFGGAESLNFNASAGTRTRSSYHAIFESPVLSDPDKRVSIDALASSTQKPWASHEEGLTGGGIKFSWSTKAGTRHQLGYTGVWRQVTGLGERASPTVRHDAGDSVKSSITYTWLADRLNHPLLPSRGYLIKTISEVAGWGLLKGDVAFWKTEVETTGALPVPIPGIKGDSGVSLTGGLRGGFLLPLALGFSGQVKPSRINDRFILGGPTDVRGFKIGGLGPHDGGNSVGGDVFAAASANLLMPLPRVGKDSPLRLQVFANAGRLLPLQDPKGKGRAGEENTLRELSSSVRRLGDALPSTAIGLGLVYAHPVARFELNFSLPVVVRRGEESRKGLQFGVGINFL